MRNLFTGLVPWFFIYSALVFVAATRGTPLDHLALVASEARVHELNGMVAKKEIVLKW